MGLKFRNTLHQYNQNESIGKGLVEKDIDGYPAVGQVFIENAFLPYHRQ